MTVKDDGKRGGTADAAGKMDEACLEFEEEEPTYRSISHLIDEDDVVVPCAQQSEKRSMFIDVFGFAFPMQILSR